MNRRGFLSGLIVSLAAPAIIRTPGLLMPVKRPRFITMIDALNTLHPDSQMRELADLLSQSNEIMNDLLWKIDPGYPLSLPSSMFRVGV